MKVLVTGAQGFIGRNLVMALEAIMRAGPDTAVDPGLITAVYQTSRYTDAELRRTLTLDADFIFHCAGADHVDDQINFLPSNLDPAQELVAALQMGGRSCPIVYISSDQAENDTAYARSKLVTEHALRAYCQSCGAPFYLFRPPVVFGRWSKPDANNPIALYCYNVCRGISFEVVKPDSYLKLVYIDDLVDTMIRCLTGSVGFDSAGCCIIDPSYRVFNGRAAETIRAFRFHDLPPKESAFTRKLYATYVAFRTEKLNGFT